MDEQRERSLKVRWVSLRWREIWKAFGWGHEKQRSVCLKWGLTGLSLVPPLLYEETHTHTAAPVPDKAQQEEAWPLAPVLPAFKTLDLHGDAGHSFTSLLGPIKCFWTHKSEVTSLCLRHEDDYTTQHQIFNEATDIKRAAHPRPARRPVLAQWRANALLTTRRMGRTFTESNAAVVTSKHCYKALYINNKREWKMIYCCTAAAAEIHSFNLVSCEYHDVMEAHY